ncbi:hypothetical protein EHM76_04390 [bacterium]|nr:MAG: hypothetical protein EHM76_04390 [bacterium]
MAELKAGATLINAQERHKRSPATFKVPSKRRLSRIARDMFVKIGIAVEGSNGERFWVIVKRHNYKEGYLIGEVNNDLVDTDLHGISCRDILRFNLENVMDIMTEKDFSNEIARAKAKSDEEHVS